MKDDGTRTSQEIYEREQLLKDFKAIEGGSIPDFALRSLKETLSHALNIMDGSGRRLPSQGLPTYGLWLNEWTELRADIFVVWEYLDKKLK